MFVGSLLTNFIISLLTKFQKLLPNILLSLQCIFRYHVSYSNVYFNNSNTSKAINCKISKVRALLTFAGKYENNGYYDNHVNNGSRSHFSIVFCIVRHKQNSEVIIPRQPGTIPTM